MSIKVMEWMAFAISITFFSPPREVGGLEGEGDRES